jgi:nitronate monooxygenase
MVSATNLIEAQLIEAAGIIIIAQGIEAGGHRGILIKLLMQPLKPVI